MLYRFDVLPTFSQPRLMFYKWCLRKMSCFIVIVSFPPLLSPDYFLSKFPGLLLIAEG